MANYSAGEHTKDLLIESAGELAAKHGFSNVSIRAVADRAGQNIGCIHYHFKSKEKLFEAVIRAASLVFRGLPYEKALVPFEAHLDRPEVQSRAIRAIVKKQISLTFDPEMPWWHSRVIYQVVHARDRLMELLYDEIVAPNIEYIKGFFKRIKPEIDDDQAFLYAMLIKSPVIFHADNAKSILGFIKKTHYDKKYLKQMEDLIVLQTQLGLGLPTDN
ncbi:MAG: TetR/AcrR family transcriptional regulator [Desulfobacterium sp.]|nr:TetR/AcrR family transcriptional regulator [Desulfobacterium sp.]